MTGVPVLGPGHPQVPRRRVEAQARVAASISPAGSSVLSHDGLQRSLVVVVVTPVCLMRAGAFTIGLWANCCLPLSAEAGSGGSGQEWGARPGYCLVCRSPTCFLGKGQCFLGHVGLGRACMDGPACSGCLPVSLGWLWTTPAVWAVVTLRSVTVCWGHCMAPTPALQPGLRGPGVSVPRGGSGDLWCFTPCLYHVLMVSRVSSPCGHLMECVFSAVRPRLARNSAVFKEKFFVMTP